VRISILALAGTLLVAVSFVLRYVLGWAPGGLLLEILPGLAVEILGAILFFVLLDYGIQRIGELNLFGIREYPQLPALDFMEAVAEKAKRVVRVLDTWSYLINDPDYWPRFREAVLEALDRGVEVEMLLIRPGSPGAQKRAEELSGVIDVEGEVELCVQRVATLAQDAESVTRTGRLSVRLYSSDAIVTMHMWDEDAYWSFFPPRDRADTNPQLMVSLRTQLGTFLGGEFDKRWNDKATVSLPDFLRETGGSPDSR
jgi:hypothetical protein